MYIDAFSPNIIIIIFLLFEVESEYEIVSFGKEAPGFRVKAK